MGLMGWLSSKGPAGKIARGVHGQFIDLKSRHPEMSEEDISNALFIHGYSTGKSLNKMERIRINKYFEDDSKIASIYDLCMAIIDIELNITERDFKAFEIARKIVVSELNKLGYTIH